MIGLAAWNAALTVVLFERPSAPQAAVAAPPIESPARLGRRWAIQPSTAMFNGTPDDVLYWGYNLVDGGGREDSTYPQFRQSFEQLFRDGGGHVFTEWNLDFLSADGRTRRRPLAVAVELPSFHIGLDNVHVTTADTVSLSFAADEEEFRNADRTATRLAIGDAGIGVGADPGAGRGATKVMVYRSADTNAMFELRTGLAAEKVWQWRYGAGVGAPPGSVAFYDATDRTAGPVVLSDGVVQTGATDRFRYREPPVRVSQQTRQAVPPGTETPVRFAGSIRSLTPPVAGNYLLIGGVVSADGRPMIARILVNGTEAAAGDGTVVGVYRLTAGDAVALTATHTASTARHTSGDARTFLSIVYVGE